VTDAERMAQIKAHLATVRAARPVVLSQAYKVMLDRIIEDIDYLMGRVETLEVQLEEARLARIDAQNPGINIEAVKAERRKAKEVMS